MTEAQIRYVLGRLGSRVTTVSSAGWVRAECPFAAWTHAKLRDENPSFAVLIVDGESKFKCYTCGVHGSVNVLPFKMYRLTGKPMAADLVRTIHAANIPNLDALKARVNVLSTGYKPGVRALGTKSKEDLLRLPDLTEDYRSGKSFVAPTGDALRYLAARRLTPEHVATWELRYNAGSRRLAIPVFDADGRIVGISGRAIDPQQKPKYLHSTGFKRDLVLYGQHLKVPRPRAYLVEGFFDVIRLHGYGYRNVFAMMGSYLSQNQLTMLREYKRVVVVPDGDKPGYDAATRAVGDLTHHGVCATAAAMPPGLDPDDLTEDMAEELLGPTDEVVASLDDAPPVG